MLKMHVHNKIKIRYAFLVKKIKNDMTRVREIEIMRLKSIKKEKLNFKEQFD